MGGGGDKYKYKNYYNITNMAQKWQYITHLLVMYLLFLIWMSGVFLKKYSR